MRYCLFFLDFYNCKGATYRKMLYLCNYMGRLILLLLAIFSLLNVSADDVIVPFRLSKLQGGLPDNNVHDIYQDSVGYIYFRNEFSIYQWDGYNYYPAPSGIENELDSIARQRHHARIDGSQGVRVSINRQGMLEYKNLQTGMNRSFRVYDLSQLRQNKRPKSFIDIDKKGRVWVAFLGFGLYMYDPNTDSFRHITKDDKERLIDTNYLSYLMIDKDDNIWIAQQNMGAVCLTVMPRQFTVLRPVASPIERAQSIRTIIRLDDGSILLGGSEGYLGRFHPNLYEIIYEKNMPSVILSAVTDSTGNLWMGSRTDGIYIDGKNYGTMTRVDDLLRDRKGRIWACGIKDAVMQVSYIPQGKGGKGMLQEKRFLSGISELSPHTLLLDHKGRIVVGSIKGVFRFDPDNLLRDSAQYEQLTDLPVIPLLEDSKKRLWAGTRGHGLMLIKDDGGHKFITVSNGLASDVVQSLAEDAHGRICVGTQNGASFYIPENGLVDQLYFYDSPLRNFFNEKAALLLNDGRMALGTIDGLVMADSDYHNTPGRINSERTMSVTHLVVNGISYNQIPKLRDRYGDICSIRNIDLEHDQNTITLSFSDFNYANHLGTIYSYYMKGLDYNWSEPSFQHSATYRNLSPGIYSFYLRRQQEDGTWSEPMELLTVRILSPWYLTWWAFIVYILMIASMSVVVWRYLRTLYRLRRDIAVERQLTKFKLDFFTNISHEFRTPLTLIQNSMERFRKVGGQIGELRMPIDRMQRNVDRMLRLINELLEFRRMQENKLHLSLEKTEVIGFMRNITYTFFDVAESRRINLMFNTQVKEFEMFVDRGFIDKMAYELLTNAFKYTPQGGSVSVNLRIGNQSFTISVEDTGIGVPEEQRATIFDRYDHGLHRRDSIGIGLNLVAGLVSAHHGKITFDNREGGGSIFCITLPTDISIYEPGDFLGEGELLAPEKQEETFPNPKVIDLQLPPMNDRRILVTEDDGDVAAYLRYELGRYFTVDIAVDGEEALNMVTDKNDAPKQYDLIITDLMMPRMSGIELCKRLRRNDKTCHIPIIMLTALCAEEKQVCGYEAGADAYITKPFSITLLLCQCRNLIERRDRYKDTYSKEVRRPKNFTPVIVTDERDLRLLHRLQSYVDAHMSDPNLSINKFVDDMKLGRTTFYNKLKNLLGQTPNEYIREQRMKKAAELLVGGPITAAEVAYQVGMSSPQYFSTCFKQRFGVTPAQYQAGARTTSEE